MATISTRELRNHTSEVLQRVRDHGELTLTVHGNPIALIAPLPQTKPVFLPKKRLLGMAQADAGLREELKELAGDTTDDLKPLR